MSEAGLTAAEFLNDADGRPRLRASSRNMAKSRERVRSPARSSRHARWPYGGTCCRRAQGPSLPFGMKSGPATHLRAIRIHLNAEQKGARGGAASQRKSFVRRSLAGGILSTARRTASSNAS
jgi:hypothetical protein